MKIFTRLIALSIMMVGFIIAVTIYLSENGIDRIYERTKERTIPLLTIFTTIKETGDIPHHQLAFNIVMTNWPSFVPYVRPVVFLNFTNSSLADKVRQAGWDVLPLEGTNKAGTPFLKDMYRTVFNRYESVFYGYANADILFDDSLVKTISDVGTKLKGLSSNVLVIGRRTNVNVDLNNTVLFEEFEKHRLRDVATRKGRLFTADAIDYFFFTKEGCSMNWSQLADVVIGRPAYDNYLVAMAIRHGVNVIDATNTILAVHISEPKVMFHGSLNKDVKYNRNIIGKFKYNDGLTSAAGLSTAEDVFGNVFIVKRGKRNNTLKKI